MNDSKSYRWRLGVIGLLLGTTIGVIVAPVLPWSFRFTPEPPRGTRAQSQAVEPDRNIEPESSTGSSSVERGTVVLRPAGTPRLLAYDGDDIDPALDALGRFLGALRPDRITCQESNHACVGTVDLYWRTEGEGDSRRLRIVALPVDPYEPDYWPVQTIEALAAWGVINEASPTTERRFADEIATTSVRTPNAPLRMTIADAAVEEFRSRGIHLAREKVAMDCECLLARGDRGEVTWSVLWNIDETWSVRHNAEPFDNWGEQSMLLAIFRRATGLEPNIRLDGFR